MKLIGSIDIRPVLKIDSINQNLTPIICKVLFVFLLTSLFSSTALARNFIVSNVSNNSQTFLIVNGTTAYTGIGTDNPSVPLDVVGDVKWSNNLTGGAVPWARLTEFPGTQCAADEAIQSIGGTLTCIKLNSTSGNISGSGTLNYVAKFTDVGKIGNSII